mgnify:CR=1 FL=1
MAVTHGFHETVFPICNAFAFSSGWNSKLKTNEYCPVAVQFAMRSAITFWRYPVLYEIDIFPFGIFLPKYLYCSVWRDSKDINFYSLSINLTWDEKNFQGSILLINLFFKLKRTDNFFTTLESCWTSLITSWFFRIINGGL